MRRVFHSFCFVSVEGDRQRRKVYKARPFAGSIPAPFTKSNEMAQFIEGKILVTVQELTDASSGQPVMTYANYKQLAARGRFVIVRPGKGLDHCALIDYQTLPSRFKERFCTLYGDPEKTMDEIRQEPLRMDPDARSYFESYELSDGTRLKGDKIEEYTLNATVLLRLLEMANLQVASRHKCGNTTPLNWPPIMASCERLREEYGHTLPHNEARLRDKIREFKRDGYACLVSGRLVNGNASKITEEGGRLIIALKCSRTPVYTNAQLLERYNEICMQKGWKPLKTQASLVSFLNRPEVKVQWMGSVMGDVAAKMTYTRMNKTVMPTVRDALWYGDGTRLNLFYKAYVDGSYRVAALNVFEVIDAASEVFLGCKISNTESFEVMYDAYRDALEFAGHKPYELVYDNQGGTKRADAREWLSKIAVISRPTAPHQAPAKSIESIFGRFQSQVLHQYWFYTGGNITARSEAARIHREFIEKNISSLPTYDEVVRLYMQARQQWNTMAHPDKRWAGKSRMDVYLGTVNPRSIELNDALRRDLFWVTTSKPSTFTAYGIQFTVAGQRLQYEVFDEAGEPDLAWRSRNTGREFYVSYDPRDLSSVRLLTRDQYGDRFEVMAQPYREIHRAAQDQTEEERSFIRRQDERNKLDRIRRHLETDALLREHGLAPDQHGLADPGLAGIGKSLERLSDKAEALRRALESTEPAPAEIYPASIGQQEKADSMLTQYDQAAALNRL